MTPRTLRHYEEIGLLAPLRKGSSRLYGERAASSRPQADRARQAAGLRARGDAPALCLI
ncbi:MAG: MerR family DNA-binding transcriptional regulator [Pseudomonadota bacterium]